MERATVRAVSVLLVDDEPAVLAALKAQLRLAGISTLTARSGEEALRVLDNHADSIGAVVSDYRMAGMNGAQLLRAVRLHWPNIPRALLSGNADLASAARAVNEGQISRLFLKPWHPTELQEDLVRLLEENRLVAENRQLRLRVEDARHAAAASVLSDREVQVLRLLTAGCTNREIAAQLLVSPATVKVHVANIMSKLGVRDRTQAAVRAIELGIVIASIRN